jgi:hypothetical protein
MRSFFHVLILAVVPAFGAPPTKIPTSVPERTVRVGETLEIRVGVKNPQSLSRLTKPKKGR